MVFCLVFLRVDLCMTSESRHKQATMPENMVFGWQFQAWPLICEPGCFKLMTWLHNENSTHIEGGFIAECWENVYKATNKRDTVSAISAQLSGFAATMSTSTCRSSFMLAVCSSVQYLFRKFHRRFDRRRSSYIYRLPLAVNIGRSEVLA